MEELGSVWRLIASCESCGGLLSLTSTAVLLRATWIGPRGFFLDALGERWPEPGELFHPQCFAVRFGRGALWASFLRGRFDKGVASDLDAEPEDAIGDVEVADMVGWDLSVTCCECGARVEASGPSVVRDSGANPDWLWVPVMQERRPGQVHVCHLSCFVRTRGRNAAYAAVGRQAWATIGPLVRKIGGAINP